MSETARQLPKWILIVSGIIALLEIMVSISLCYSPGSVMETVDLNAKGVDFLIYIWASRQLALGIIFGVATIKRSAPMLSLAWIFFLVMMIGDLVIGIVEKQNPMIISALVMGLVSAAMIYVINKKR